MKLDLNVKFKGLDGKESETLILGREFAGLLAGSNKGDILKYYDWAMKLYALQPIEVDRSDLEKIKEFVEGHEQMTIMFKAQLIEILNKA